MNREHITTFTVDFEWCHEILQEVSRTFALSVSQLHNPIADELCVGYLLCRVADTVEDAKHIAPAEQTRLLNLYRSVLSPDNAVTATEFVAEVNEWVPEPRNPEWELVTETPRLITTFEALPRETKQEIRPPIDEMIHGMTIFIDRYDEEGGLRIQTMDELEQYCWYVAGTVGELITGLVTLDGGTDVPPDLEETAGSFGLLLQLVNVTKDIATDYEEENNVYVPESLLTKYGLEHEDIGDTSQSEAFAPVIRELVTQAEQHIGDTRVWLDAAPERRGNTLSACALPFLLCVGTLRELKARPADVIREGDVKVSREEVFAVISAFSRDDRPSLATLQSDIQSAPYHK